MRTAGGLRGAWSERERKRSAHLHAPGSAEPADGRPGWGALVVLAFLAAGLLIGAFAIN
ncbi:MAG TPA: hypothetical protein VG520_10060 [Candidatus Dormibacteraeota bacterium]|nr:hypothetical protein [Candidatus Dormibacteraeota bacterium]